MAQAIQADCTIQIDALNNVFLAPLEIASARGRALDLSGFEYLWEVYKPVEKRRWGYYTLPTLYSDRLVARLDPKLERSTNTLAVKGFWLEQEVLEDAAFLNALAAGLQRFAQFAGAEKNQSGIRPAGGDAGFATTDLMKGSRL